MKVRIAVPFIQFDVYEIEVPEGITVEAIMDQFDTERSEDKLDKPDTYDVGCLQDYNDDNGEAYPFIIDGEDLDRYILVEKGEGS